MKQLRAVGAWTLCIVCAPFLGAAIAFMWLYFVLTVLLQMAVGKKEWDFTAWWNPKRSTGRDR